MPRDAFFQFVTGLAKTMGSGEASTPPKAATQLRPQEEALLARYRRLPPKFQRRLREYADELESLAGAERA